MPKAKTPTAKLLQLDTTLQPFESSVVYYGFHLIRQL